MSKSNGESRKQKDPPGFDVERMILLQGLDLEAWLNDLLPLKEQAMDRLMPHFTSLSRAERDPSQSTWVRALSRIQALAKRGVPREKLERIPMAVNTILAAAYVSGPDTPLAELLVEYSQASSEVQVAFVEALVDGEFEPEEKIEVARELEEAGSVANELSRQLRQDASVAGVG